MKWATWLRALRKASWLAVFVALPMGACSAGDPVEPGSEPVAAVAQELCQADGCPACKYCNNGFCDPSPGDSCINGVCDGNASCCSGCLNGANTCQLGTTTAACGKGNYCQVCAAATQCQTNACTAGTCTTPKVADNTACTGGKCLGGACCTGCLSGTTCSAGNALTACGKGGGNCASCDTGNECMIGSCSSGACTSMPATPGTPCGGGTGKCENAACCTGCWDGVTCQPGNVLGVCGKGGAACASCTDTNACSTDACTAGVCTHDTIVGCSDGKCGGTSPPDCDDKKPCTTDTCDPMTGCVNTNADGIDCDDGDACTQHDSCEAGACKPGAPVDCQPSDECHAAGACDASGKCSNPAKKDGAACTGGACKNAKCVQGSTPTGDAGAAGEEAGAAGAGGDNGDGGKAGKGGASSRAGSAGNEQGADAGDVGNGAAGLYARDPGGCSCRFGGERSRGTGALFAASLALFALVRRRKRSELARRAT